MEKRQDRKPQRPKGRKQEAGSDCAPGAGLALGKGDLGFMSMKQRRPRLDGQRKQKEASQGDRHF